MAIGLGRTYLYSAAKFEMSGIGAQLERKRKEQSLMWSAA
jgi:hypothetical protein